MAMQDRGYVSGYILRDKNNEEQLEMARGILDVINKDAINPLPRLTPKDYDPLKVKTLRPSLFEEDYHGDVDNP